MFCILGGRDFADVLANGQTTMNHVISTQNLAALHTTGTIVDYSGANVRSVLFVCWGNVCRSPAGTSVLKRHLKTRNLESIVQVDSAGVSFDNVLPRPSLWMRWAAFRRGYVLKQRARRINRRELNNVDLVIAMDRRILHVLHALHKNPSSTIKLLSDFLPDGWPQDVPDPMNRCKRICNRVFDMLELACPKIVENLCGQGVG